MQEVFEKNFFINENNLIRVHLPNGKVIIVSCDENNDVKIIFEDKEISLSQTCLQEKQAKSSLT